MFGGAEPVWPGTRLLYVPSTVRRPNGTRELGSRERMSSPAACRFGDDDLVENELQVGSDEMHAGAGGRDDFVRPAAARGGATTASCDRRGRRREHRLQHAVGIR